jgi:hypothetical protein
MMTQLKGFHLVVDPHISQFNIGGSMTAIPSQDENRYHNIPPQFHSFSCGRLLLLSRFSDKLKDKKSKADFLAYH